jgi:hypothetical protein
MRAISCLFVLCAIGCGSMKTDERHAGTGSIQGEVQGLSLASTSGVSIARSFPPSTEIKIAPDSVSCETVQAGERITIDLGGASPGQYTVVKGYPSKADLSTNQARAHACPADGSPCHDLVRSGTVTVSRYDSEVGGHVEGTFEITFADGTVSGSFSAIRCD